MQTLNQNQNGDALKDYKKRVAQHLKVISNEMYVYSDEIKSFLDYACDTICNGNKCIVLQGNVGSGKSILMKTLCDAYINPKHGGSIKFVTAIELVDRFRADGYNGIKPFLTKNLCIDEVGLEHSQVKVPFDGATENVIRYIFLKRYDLFINTGGKIKTHLITNLTDKQLDAFYGGGTSENTDTDKRFISRLELMRAKKTVLGASQDYMDYRKLGLVFHYKPFDWQAWEEYISNRNKEYNGNLNQLALDAIERDLDYYKQGKKIYDSGGVKWKFLLSINDSIAIDIQDTHNPSGSIFDVAMFLSSKPSDEEKCYVRWLKNKSNQ